MPKDFQARLEARPMARQLAKSVRGMPFKEAVFLIEHALDLFSVQLDPHAPDDVVESAYIDFDSWYNELDANSKAIVDHVTIGVLTNVAEQAKSNRRIGVPDRREHPWWIRRR